VCWLKAGGRRQKGSVPARGTYELELPHPVSTPRRIRLPPVDETPRVRRRAGVLGRRRPRLPLISSGPPDRRLKPCRPDWRPPEFDGRGRRPFWLDGDLEASRSPSNELLPWEKNSSSRRRWAGRWPAFPPPRRGARQQHERMPATIARRGSPRPRGAIRSGRARRQRFSGSHAGRAHRPAGRKGRPAGRARATCP